MASTNGFMGLLVGRLVDKDVEKGTCSVKVDGIVTVFRNNKTKQPKSLVGKTVELEGLQDRFLDRLLLLKKGETLQFGASGLEGAQMRVIEVFRKVGPYDPADYPEVTDGFRGFHGAVVGTVVKKDPSFMQLIVKLDSIRDTWDDNQAKTPKSMVGKPFLLWGFYKYRKQFELIKVGDTIEVGLKHQQPQGNHLNIDRFVRKPDGRVAMQDKEMMDYSSGIQKFNGMLVGRLVSKDIEKGEFSVQVDRVSRVWRNSKAEKPKSLVGKTVKVGGVTGKWLDVLLLVDKGETMEFECQHAGGDAMRFPGEMMRKVPAVKPGEYPELPEEFRGFHGAIKATVVKKDPELLEMIVKATDVEETWKKNRAEQPESIVGKRFILAGFWNRRDTYNDLKVGDQIDVGLEHISVRSDHVSIAEYVRKAEPKND